MYVNVFVFCHSSLYTAVRLTMVREQRFIRIIYYYYLSTFTCDGQAEIQSTALHAVRAVGNFAFLISALFVTFIQIQFFPSLFEHKILLWTLSCDFAAQNK